MKKQKLYDLFFPAGKNIRFKKLRWTILIMIQEASMCKWKAILKFYYKASYRRDIRRLRDVLSQGKLKGTKRLMSLNQIEFSHEINYPEWVWELERRLMDDGDDYKTIKVHLMPDTNRYAVIDGNHRLMALKNHYGHSSKILVRVLELTYESTDTEPCLCHGTCAQQIIDEETCHCEQFNNQI